MQVAATRPPRLFTLRRVVMSLLLAVGVVGVGFAFSEGQDEPPRVTIPGIDRVFPEPHSFALRQDRVIADLAFGYDGVLQIDGVEIPEDQLQRTRELGVMSFAPGEGREFEMFAPGRHTATVVYWRATEERGVDDQEFSWVFNVH